MTIVDHSAYIGGLNMNVFFLHFNSGRCDVMDVEEFRKRGKEMVDYVADYLENIRDRRPLSNVKPGYLRELIPDEAPRDPEPWDDVFRDIERVIMPGVSTQR